MDLARLEDWLGAKVLRDSAGATRLVCCDEMSEGHAGLTFGYTVAAADGGTSDFVLKLAPPGVTRRGNTDVYRQAPLLRALRTGGLPVPDVPSASSEDTELGTSYLVMERLPGRPFLIWQPDRSFDLDPFSVAPLWRQAGVVLARIHAFDWRYRLPDWQPIRSPSEELAHWCRILDKSEDTEKVREGRTLAQLLADHLPPVGPIGVCHGDFQPGNILYVGLEMTGVIDWELSSIGAQTLDLGWLLTMGHGPSWAEDWQPATALSRDELIATYATARGCAVEHIEWFEALACFRMGAIACFNLRLHRSGRRVDDIWERFASSIGTLFANGFALSRGFWRQTWQAG